MYVEELREYRRYLQQHATNEDLRSLNLLGVQFALCECSKHWFYLRYESGSAIELTPCLSRVPSQTLGKPALSVCLSLSLPVSRSEDHSTSLPVGTLS